MSEDRADLEDTWEEWVRVAEKALRDFRARGIQVEKVDVDVEELVRWCQAKRQPINAASRSAFAAEMLRDRDRRVGIKGFSTASAHRMESYSVKERTRDRSDCSIGLCFRSASRRR